MEVDQDAQEAPKVLAPKDYLGTPNFDQGLRVGDDKRGKEACTNPLFGGGLSADTILVVVV